MLYPNNIESKLGFLQIKEIIKEYSDGAVAKELSEQLTFVSDFDLVSKMHNQTFEFVDILHNKKRSFPSNNFIDIQAMASKLAVVGAYVFEEEWLRVRSSLRTLNACVQYLDHEDSAG
ncbi:MAG TPA: hypothetical protein VL947_01030, partial [Cytophagales bacterium]|nr:hypothetical protein [Cytophagales bacterium]